MREVMSSEERKGWDWGLVWERTLVSLLKGLSLSGGFWLESCKQSTFHLFPKDTQDLKRN